MATDGDLYTCFRAMIGVKMNLISETNPRFWLTADELVSSSELVIDRPKGSRHPRFSSIIYPLDYGYLDGTGAVDGGGVDVWIGSLTDRAVVGILATVDLFKKDSEIKLLIGCTEAEMQQALETSNSESQSAILIRRPVS